MASWHGRPRQTPSDSRLRSRSPTSWPCWKRLVNEFELRRLLPILISRCIFCTVLARIIQQITWRWSSGQTFSFSVSSFLSQSKTRVRFHRLGIALFCFVPISSASSPPPKSKTPLWAWGYGFAVGNNLDHIGYEDTFVGQSGPIPGPDSLCSL